MKIEFAPDGSIKLSGYTSSEEKNIKSVNLDSSSTHISEFEKSLELIPHLEVIKLIGEMDFPVGRKLISEVIRGDNNDRVRKLRLDNLSSFGCLSLYDDKDVQELLDRMIVSGLIEITKLPKSKYYPVIVITSKGKLELSKPSLSSNNLGNFSDCIKSNSCITESDKEIFKSLDFFLGKYNDEQKKAIIENSSKILCIAGAGSGKTTVLTKRIEFLTKFRNVSNDNILAITFTRKARHEMRERLLKLFPETKFHIETFNSFCEKILQKNSYLAYHSNDVIKVMDYSSKINIILTSLSKMGYSADDAVEKYYSNKSAHSLKDGKKQLFFGFVNDVFSLLDHYSQNEKSLSFMKNVVLNCSDYNDKSIGLFVYELVELVFEAKKERGLRDYSDQIVHTLKLFRTHPNSIPKFEHILVDEYQDVNDVQVKLLDILSPTNLFVVGDPRQSIYGWRGSKVENIMQFSEKHKDSSIIQLTKNYRSTKNIVELSNSIISSMGLKDLESVSDSGCDVTLISHPDEASEHLFVAQSILSQTISRKNIFILARTNRQLEAISTVLEANNISILKRTIEELKDNMTPNEDQVTLSTVHAIKGLEAELVYMIGVNTQMYPCMASEHPILSIVKLDDSYDKYAEELRLLYVGITRAKKQLVVSYCGNISKFLNDKQKKLMSYVNLDSQSSFGNKTWKESKRFSSLFDQLREWRREISKRDNVKPYIVFSDRTLDEIVMKKPSNFYELQGINGIGPQKIMKYGEDIIAIVSGFK